MTTIIRPSLISFPIIGEPISSQSKKLKRKWQSLVTETVQKYQNRPLGIDTKLELQIDWFSGKDRNRADVDNIVKPIVDGLKNVVYIDDNQVYNIAAKYHDLNSVLTFVDQPVCIVNPLLDGEKEYVYVRVYKVY